MEINFGYPTIVTSTDEAYVKLYFKMAVNVKTNILAYSSLSFLGEVGGYVGLILGFSLFDLSKIMQNFTSGKRKHKTKKMKVTPVETPHQQF